MILHSLTTETPGWKPGDTAGWEARRYKRRGGGHLCLPPGSQPELTAVSLSHQTTRLAAVAPKRRFGAP